jgi:hypothetical protein
MTDDDLYRLTKLHDDIRKEVFSSDRQDDLLWLLMEKLGQEVVLLRAAIEGKDLRIRSRSLEHDERR